MRNWLRSMVSGVREWWRARRAKRAMLDSLRHERDAYHALCKASGITTGRVMDLANLALVLDRLLHLMLDTAETQQPHTAQLAIRDANDALPTVFLWASTSRQSPEERCSVLARERDDAKTDLENARKRMTSLESGRDAARQDREHYWATLVAVETALTAAGYPELPGGPDAAERIGYLHAARKDVDRWIPTHERLPAKDDANQLCELVLQSGDVWLGTWEPEVTGGLGGSHSWWRFKVPDTVEYVFPVHDVAFWRLFRRTPFESYVQARFRHVGGLAKEPKA